MAEDILLSIVIVAGPKDNELVQRNLELIARKNVDTLYHVFVIDNGKFHGASPILSDALNVTVCEGVPFDLQKPKACRGSYQHAAALTQFMQQQEFYSRFLLILDPDFFILQPDWISNVCQYVKNKNLVFFGAPWHPKWFTKYRHFPCVHCMFIDTQKVDCKKLNFMPDLISRGLKEDAKQGNATSHTQCNAKQWFSVFLLIAVGALAEIKNAYKEVGQKQPFFLMLIYKVLCTLDHSLNFSKKFVRLVRKSILNRRFVGSSNDTGYLIHKIYKNKVPSETLVPSMSIPGDFPAVAWADSFLWLFFEKFVPDRWSYIPNGKDYFTDKKFSDTRLPDLNSLGWEEFFWRDHPFGFHMRRYNKLTRNYDSEVEMLQRILSPELAVNSSKY